MITIRSFNLIEMLWPYKGIYFSICYISLSIKVRSLVPYTFVWIVNTSFHMGYLQFMKGLFRITILGSYIVNVHYLLINLPQCLQIYMRAFTVNDRPFLNKVMCWIQWLLICRMNVANIHIDYITYVSHHMVLIVVLLLCNHRIHI